MQATHAFRLSPQQRHSWESANAGAEQGCQCALLIEGAFERERLQEIIGQIVQRHEILRTTFYRQPGLKFPLQVIHETGSPSWKEIDLQNVGASRAGEKLEHELLKQRQIRIARESGSQLDVLLICMEPGKHVVSMALPFMCCDTATLVNLTREIIQGLTATSQPAGDEETTQYLQFSEWQNDLAEEEQSKSGMDYWHTIYRSDTPAWEMPFSSPQDSRTQEASSTALAFTGQALHSIETAATQCGIAMNVFLLACWETFLYRITGQLEFRSGYISDGRKFKELETAMGPFALALPIQLPLDEGSPFSEVSRRLGNRLNEALDWQEYFLLSNAGSEAGHQWPALFEYTAWPVPYQDKTLRISLHSVSGESPFALKLLCRKDHDKLAVELAYDSSVTRKEYAENMLAELKVLIESVAQDPHVRIEDLLILSDQDKQLINSLRETSRHWAGSHDIVEMFDAQVAENPRANAVICEENILTYDELGQMTSQLSWYLVAAGVQPETRVLLLLPRSELMVVGLLSVLKAGGAYVPVEPSTPPARLQYLLQETGAFFVITIASLLPLLKDVVVTPIVLDRDEQVIAIYEKVAIAPIQPQNLAYILFTSGSTGKPKGVAVERLQLHNYVRGAMERMAIKAGSQLAMVSSFAADLGNTVLFPALCGGGCLHLISPEKVTDASAVADYFSRMKIGCLKIVPSHFAALLQASAHERQLIPQDLLVFGGEALPWWLIDQVVEIAPECRLFNHYGPTETTVGVMTYEVTAGQVRWGLTVPLGLPLPNLQLYVLDKHQRPVPTGVRGELFIGGAGVCRGYWNRSDLTAERFLPDPWSKNAGARMYRTGDRVRMLPDGTLEYLDRVDRQIKLRGFRVELGEIERAILDCTEVRQAAVELLVSVSGEEQLVAFVGVRRDQKITSEHLRNALRDILPEHMVPATFVVLEGLPLTENGKIDRQVLKSFENLEKEHAGSVAPREMGEELLAGLWREVLGVPRIGVKDNFFELGGDSLIATQLVSRVRKLFRIELPVRIVFEAPTVAEMALHINQVLSGKAQLSVVPIVPVDRNSELILSFGQERLWGIHQLDPSSWAYNSAASLRLTGTLDEEALEWALNEIVRRHEVLRTLFVATDGRPRQVIHPPVPIELPETSLRSLQGDELEKEVKRLVNEHSEQPFDLAHGPLLRLKLLSIDETTNILLISMHHIVTDGWSQNVFISELTVLYESHLNNVPSPLPDLAIQYADFAAWQRQLLQGQHLEELLAYWRDHLAGAPQTLNFPTDFPRSPTPSYEGSCIVWQHSPEQVVQLKQVSREEGVTLFMTLLTTYYIFLHYYTGQEDIVIGTDIANRNRLETENLIGFFINNLALRVSLSGDPTFRELLDRVKTAALGAYTHQDLPFATLVKNLRPKRSLSHTPVFQTLFVLQNSPIEEMAPRELQAVPINSDMTTSKLDLALLLAESSEGLTAYWTYRKELFRPETITEIGKDFNRILGSIFQHLDSPLSTLLQNERNQKHEKNLRFSSKKIHANQEKLDPALGGRTHSN